MTRRGGAAALLLLGLHPSGASLAATARPAAPAFPNPALSVQGAETPFGTSGPQDDGPPAVLPPGARFDTARIAMDSVAIGFANAPLAIPAGAPMAARAGEVAPGPASSVTAPSTAEAPSGRISGAADRAGRAEADAGPPDSLPPGARFDTGQIVFQHGDIQFRNAQFGAATSPLSAPGGAALPGGMAMRAEGRGLRITLDADVLFDFDRAELRQDAAPRLRRLMEEVSARIARPAFRVEGHTDSIGTDAHNLRLSARRAEAVRSWLAQNGGVPRPAVSTVGYGESRPVAPNSTPEGRDDPEGRQQNRRVELLVTPR